MSPLDLLPEFPPLSARELAVTPDLVCVAADVLARTADCPTCGSSSDRVHCRYPVRGRAHRHNSASDKPQNTWACSTLSTPSASTDSGAGS